jgi:hypothetical protein
MLGTDMNKDEDDEDGTVHEGSKDINAPELKVVRINAILNRTEA